MVFCNTKRETRDVAEALCEHGFSALALHGDLEQRDRDRTLVLFANQSASILVATDVAARGLDIDALDAVFNYGIARELEVHVHRIGRTGRAGSSGMACTLYGPKEAFRLEKLGERLGETFEPEALPSRQALAESPPAADGHAADRRRAQAEGAPRRYPRCPDRRRGFVRGCGRQDQGA